MGKPKNKEVTKSNTQTKPLVKTVTQLKREGALNKKSNNGLVKNNASTKFGHSVSTPHKNERQLSLYGNLTKPKLPEVHVALPNLPTLGQVVKFGSDAINALPAIYASSKLVGLLGGKSIAGVSGRYVASILEKVGLFGLKGLGVGAKTIAKVGTKVLGPIPTIMLGTTAVAASADVGLQINDWIKYLSTHDKSIKDKIDAYTPDILERSFSENYDRWLAGDLGTDAAELLPYIFNTLTGKYTRDTIKEAINNG